MFAIVGADGKTGSAVVRRLLAQKRPVRAIVRGETSAAGLRKTRRATKSLYDTLAALAGTGA